MNNKTYSRSLFQRLLCTMLVLVMVFSLTACFDQKDPTTNPPVTTLTGNSSTTGSTATVPTTVPTQPTTSLPLPTTVPTQPTTQPVPEDPDALVYTLTQDEVDLYYTLLADCEALSIEGLDMDAIDEATMALDECYNYLNAQCSIALILHYSHTKDSSLEKQYLDCVEICTQANDAYLQMAKKVYQSDTPAKDALFEGWTEEDIADLLAYQEEITLIQQRNAEIGVEYRATTNDNVKMQLYVEFVQNNNRIAELYGYENYYTYAYKKVYERDYDQKAVASMRKYAKDYLAKIFPIALMNFNTAYNMDATQNDQRMIRYFLFNNYNAVGKDYVGMYIDSLPEGFQEIMRNMLEHDSLFTDAEDAMEGAFTTMIGDRSYCYFGPGYASSSTVIHEGGHYYASRFTDLNSIPLDLAETHSQGNEWLFITYLAEKMPSKQHRAIVDYLLYEDIAMAIICLMVDEFEQRVYSTDVSDFTARDFDAIMDAICLEYFPNGNVENDLADMKYYWRQVVVDQPIYYISYAVSGIAAMSLFTEANADYDHAMEIYRKLCEEPALEAGFLSNIRQAGLATPFDAKFYKELKKLVESRS